MLIHLVWQHNLIWLVFIKRDKTDAVNLETVCLDLIKLSNVWKNYVVKKTVYDELVKKVNAIQSNDTSDLVQKADYNTS